MKVFISWSGKRSKELANSLRDWLPCVLQYVEPFVSDKDISAGDRWAQAIAGELESSNFGIICITPENLTSEWILFEAGALSKSMQDGKVIPLLFGLELSDLSGPLSQFQAKKVDQGGLMEAVQAINSIAETKTSEDIISRSVPAMWPTLQTAIDAIPDKEPTEKHMRPQHEILEELVTGVRGISSRMREFSDPDLIDRGPRYSSKKYRFHPMMLEEIMDISSENDSGSLALLMFAGLVRDEMPWLSEVLTETYRELKHANHKEAEKISLRLRRVMKSMMHGRMAESMMRGSKSNHMLAMELPHMVERIVDRSIDLRRNSSKPDDNEDIDYDDEAKKMLGG